MRTTLLVVHALVAGAFLGLPGARGEEEVAGKRDVPLPKLTTLEDPSALGLEFKFKKPELWAKTTNDLVRGLFQTQGIGLEVDGLYSLQDRHKSEHFNGNVSYDLAGKRQYERHPSLNTPMGPPYRYSLSLKAGLESAPGTTNTAQSAEWELSKETVGLEASWQIPQSRKLDLFSFLRCNRNNAPDPITLAGFFSGVFNETGEGKDTERYGFSLDWGIPITEDPALRHFSLFFFPSY